MTDGPSDLARFLAGDGAAFDRVVEAYQAPLLRFARGVLGDAAAAQDVVQETFIRLLRSAGSLQEHGKLQSWLYRTCRNLAIDQMRKEKSMGRTEHQASAEGGAEFPAPDGEVERKAMFEHVAVRMQKLTPKERECIVLKVLEGKSYREIADITGISVSNVGFQIHNGLKRLSAFVGGNRS